MPSFLGTKKFGCHLRYPHRQMVIEFFQSPSNTPTPSNGNQKISVISWWCTCVKWWPKEFSQHLIDYDYQMVIKFYWLPRKGVVSYVLVEGFLKTYDTPPFCGDWNILITIKRGDQNVFSCRKTSILKFWIVTRLVIENFGCHKVWPLKKFNPHTLRQLKIILVVVPCVNWFFFLVTTRYGDWIFSVTTRFMVIEIGLVSIAHMFVSSNLKVLMT